MSLIYSILKPVLRKASAGRAVMTRENVVRQAEKKQRRNLTFSEIASYEKQEREIAGCRCIVYSKNGSDHSKAKTKTGRISQACFWK
ncbi:hypothetical protein [Butyrivibrio fibrisolvens]|jgi:hypothetical protein|uniref:hypothetical protein n=1 Tax=Butyrivibrio fibrisolvens TaxID=831 RepID=UPI0003B69122|nr:hypothetical protein [Butyrivibrio fibrisolvens]